MCQLKQSFAHYGPGSEGVTTTSVSLLNRLRLGTDPRDWQRFVRLYTPLLLHWARTAGAQEADAADLTQDVLTIFIHKLPTFKYDSNRSFRAWLRILLLNKWRDACRQRDVCVDPHVLKMAYTRDEAWEEQQEREDRQRLVARALEVIRNDFQPHVWSAFWDSLTSGRDAASIAVSLGVSVEVVYSAKCRILRRLRAELEGALD